MNLKNMKSSETTEQIKIFMWAERQLFIAPELSLMYHVPNEGVRKKSTGAILKAEGMKAGVPDIVLPVSRLGYNGLYIELKYGSNRTTPAQKQFIEGLRSCGYKAEVAYGYEAAREIIRHYLQKAPGFNLVNCEHASKVWDYCEGVTVKETLAAGAPCVSCPNYKNNKKKEGE